MLGWKNIIFIANFNDFDEDKYSLLKTDNVNFFFPFDLLKQSTIFLSLFKGQTVSIKHISNGFLKGMLVLL